MKGVDTTYLIDLLKGEKGAVEKGRQMEAVNTIVTTQINLFEVVTGLEMSSMGNKKKKAKRAQLDQLFERLQVFLLDREGALNAARIMGELKRKGAPIDTLDVLVGGILISRGCRVLVTRNKKHFKNIKSLKIEDY